MAKLDTGRVIRQTRELITEGKRLHEWSRRAVSASKDMAKVVAASVSASRRVRRDSKRRKRLLQKSARIHLLLRTLLQWGLTVNVR